MSGADDVDDLIETLLAPLPGDEACGVYTRDDVSPQSLYYRMRDARANARLADRRAETEFDSVAGSGAEPWRQVIQLARHALATETKDVEIAVWLFEGLVRVDGLMGFMVGASVLTGLLRTFWGQGLHPAPEEDDPWATLAALRGLSGDDFVGTLVQPLRNTTILVLGDGTRVSSWSYNYARDLSALPPAKRQAIRVPDHQPDFKDIERFAEGSGRPQLATAARLAAEALEAWAHLDAAVTATGSPPLSTSQVQEVLHGIREITGRYVKDVPVVPPTDLASAATAGATRDSATRAPSSSASVGSREMTVGGAGSLSRENLLEQVLAIAAIFRAREPNAPISFTLDEAVRRARMPMTDLFQELVPDERTRAALMVSLGLRVGGDYSALPVTGNLDDRIEPVTSPERRKPADTAPSEPAEAGASEDDENLGF